MENGEIELSFKMNVSSNLGDFDCLTESSLEATIRKCAESSLDDIWISGAKKYPCLAILMNGEQACLTYFRAEEGEIYGSLGDRQRDGVVEFCAEG